MSIGLNFIVDKNNTHSKESSEIQYLQSNQFLRVYISALFQLMCISACISNLLRYCTQKRSFLNPGFKLFKVLKKVVYFFLFFGGTLAEPFKIEVTAPPFLRRSFWGDSCGGLMFSQRFLSFRITTRPDHKTCWAEQVSRYQT